MFTALSSIDLLSVLLAFAGNFLVGMIWYSPVVFGNTWMDLVGLTPEKIKKAGGPARAMMVAVGAGFLSALSMAIVFALIDVRTVPQGIIVALLLWLGFNAVSHAKHAAFEGRPARLVAISAGGDLVGAVVMGVILGAWR